MKIKITLDSTDMKQAVAAHCRAMLSLPVDAEDVHTGGYSWDTPYIEFDTDEKQAETSLAAEQAATDRFKDLEAA